ncbi:hypothetical protein [Paracoccus sp. MKU1]|uniref:hypothetical protein n=1 Tax=Paracoccus sp. MKU1 TaxID=1745182 RepID=UPI00128F0B40|nr:hypothetical protein [Paracoccus sp. MKU1]
MVDLASFWVGDRLGPIEIASLQSFLRHGDRITLFSPTPLADLPPGVIWRDANGIFPSRRILRYRANGSPALHADLFRYALLAQTDMIWVDLDIIALRPFAYASPWIFGYEGSSTVNNAVLRLPESSDTLRLLQQFQPDTVGLPPFMSGFRRFKYQLRTFGRGMSIERWPWGATGPRGLTHFLRLTGEISHALPVSAFYAISKDDAGRFLVPGALRASDLPSDAWCVHLWAKELRQELRRHHHGQVPAGSFLDLAIRGEL